jgi:hypothetical protein
MGTASKALSVLFRLAELTCAVIVIGILSRFIYLVDLGHGHVESKIIYTEVWAALSMAFSIILVPPISYSFYACPLDLIMFIGWMVSFGLLYDVNLPLTHILLSFSSLRMVIAKFRQLTGPHLCSSYWYYHYWGYYWGRFWYTPGINITFNTIGTVGCSEWRTILAFAFIGGFCWLANTLIVRI